ncbi:hypothetical protein WJX72_005042 [[Myrmecia] bisecta]|uniref:Cilia- and flagella-associated protein 206 n=1 Tax=[Myrmecia] bisecta TaxID=41462 RepID=A0AAW1QF79_9CHLO
MGIDSLTQTLVSQTLRACREGGANHVDATIAAFLNRVAILQARLTRQTEQSDAGALEAAASKLSTTVCSSLLSQGSMALRTVQLQVGFEQAIRQQQAQVEQEQVERQQRVARALNAVAGPAGVRDDTSELVADALQRVFRYVVVKAGLEAACQDEQAAGEVEAALHSVFGHPSLARFVGLSAADKHKEMAELADVVLGICIYNQRVGAGGAVASALLLGYQGQAQQLQQQAEQAAANVQQRIAIYIHHVNARSAVENAMQPGMVRLCEEVAHARQSLVYYRQIQQDLSTTLAMLEDVEAQSEEQLLKLQACIEGAQGVARETVFPVFKQLGALQGAAGQARRMLVVHQRLLDTLAAAPGDFTPSLDQRTLSGLAAGPKPAGPPLLADQLGPRTPANLATAEALSGAERLPPPRDGSLKLHIELGGFCPVTLVKRNGLLLPLDPRLGYVRFEGRLYGCAGRTEMDWFAASPAEYIASAHAHAIKSPDLLQLLELSQVYPEVAIGALLTDLATSKMVCEFGSQTVTHPIESNKDPSYEWNEWALRRKALALANLRQKRTHSTQTALSHFKRDNQTQVYKPKGVSTQTVVNKGQSMPRQMRHVAGLRGAPDSKMRVVNLELDVGQPHEF